MRMAQVARQNRQGSTGVVSNPSTPAQQEKSIAKIIPVYSALYTPSFSLRKILFLLYFTFSSRQSVADWQHDFGRGDASFGCFEPPRASGAAQRESVENLPDLFGYRVFILTGFYTYQVSIITRYFI